MLNCEPNNPMNKTLTIDTSASEVAIATIRFIFFLTKKSTRGLNRMAIIVEYIIGIIMC